MGQTLHFEYTVGGLSTIYAVCVRDDGLIVTLDDGMSSFSSSYWSDAAISMAEVDAGSGKYFGIFFGGGGTSPAGRYTAMFFNNASPSISDAVLGSYRFDFDGENIITDPALTSLSDIAAVVWSALTSGMTTTGSVGKKLGTWILGSDNKILLSNNAQTGVTIPTVTAITDAVVLPTGTSAGQINLSSGAVTLQAGQTVTAATVSDKTGYSLSGTQTFNLAGNITGNLSGSVGGDLAGKVLGGGSSTITGVGAQVSGSGGGNVTIGGYASGQDPATLLTASTPFLDAVASAAVGAGRGSVAINQNVGGTDNLRYVDQNGQGIGDANVLIYLAGDWPAYPDRVQAAATTGPDGRWLSPAFVDSGTYVAVFTKLGADGPDVSSPFTV